MIRMPRESLDVLGSQNTGILCFLSVHPCNMTIRMKVSIQGRENRQGGKKSRFSKNPHRRWASVGHKSDTVRN